MIAKILAAAGLAGLLAATPATNAGNCNDVRVQDLFGTDFHADVQACDWPTLGFTAIQYDIDWAGIHIGTSSLVRRLPSDDAPIQQTIAGTSHLVVPAANVTWGDFAYGNDNVLYVAGGY